MKHLSFYSFALIFFAFTSNCDNQQQTESSSQDQEVAEVTQSYTDLSQSEFKAMETNLPEDVVILDVRTDQEVAEGMIDGAIQIDFRGENFRDDIARMDTSKTYVVYCRSGGRSSAASQMMTEELGFKKVNNLLGGYSEYSSGN